MKIYLTTDIDVTKIMADVKQKSDKKENENFLNNLLNHKDIHEFLHNKVLQRKKSSIYKEIQEYLKKPITNNEYSDFNQNELEKNLKLANINHDINIHKPILSGRNKIIRGLALKIRNLIQNEIRFTMDPIIKNQEVYNSYSIKTINEIVKYIKLSAEEKKNNEKLRLEFQDAIKTELKKIEENLNDKVNDSMIGKNTDFYQEDQNLKSTIRKNYFEILERDCSNDEYEFYFQKIKNKEIDKSDLKDVFKNSEEYHNLQEYKKVFHEYSSKIIKPIIIFGVPRVGTTLVHSILCANSKLGSFSDEDISRWLSLEEQFEIEKYYNWLQQNDKKIPISESSLFAFGKNGPGLKHFGIPPKGTTKIPIEGELFWKKKFGLDYVSDIGIISKVEIVKEIVELLKNQSKNRFVCKAPNHSMRLFALKKIFPDAKFINVARDPRPVINSMMQRFVEEGQFEPGIPINDKLKFSIYNQYEKFALLYKEVTEHIHEFYEKNPDNFLTVYYEELAKQPKQIVKDILEFCELDINSIDEVIPSIKKINEKWRDKISQEEQNKIFDIVAPAISKMKYPYKI